MRFLKLNGKKFAQLKIMAGTYSLKFHYFIVNPIGVEPMTFGFRKPMLYPTELRVHPFGDACLQEKKTNNVYTIPLTGMEVNFNLKRGLVQIVIFTAQ